MNDMLDVRCTGILRGVLSEFAHTIERVAVFGSYATGKARDNSDIDLVIYGSLSTAEIDRLWTLFDESDLAVPIVSVSLGLPAVFMFGTDQRKARPQRIRLLHGVAYDDDLYPPLKRHIDTIARPLFERSDLV